MVGASTAPLIHWRACVCPPELADGDLHLWRIDADRLGENQLQAAATWPLLSAAELERGQRLRIPKLRRRFFVTHAATRRILAHYLDCPPDRITFATAATGKPWIVAPATDLEFNLSTTDDLALLGVRRREPLGVDCELLRERLDLLGIARRMFGAAQTERLARLPERERLLGFYLAWTALEARVKRDGRGLPGYREPDPPEIAVGHARPRLDAICAIAGRALPAVTAWTTLAWSPATDREFAAA